MFGTSREKPSYNFVNDGVVVGEPLETVQNGVGRFYRYGEGRDYPSITTVLGRFVADGLQEWIDAVPEEKRNAILRKAAARGTALHDGVEAYILGKGEPTNPFDRERFISIKPLLKRINNIVALERVYYSDIYRIAGRTDCIAEFDGILSVIDFKTSSKPKTEEQIIKYFEQETGYSLMFKEHHNVQINQIVTIISVDHSPKPQLFIRQPSDYVDSLVEKIGKFQDEIDISSMFSTGANSM